MSDHLSNLKIDHATLRLLAFCLLSSNAEWLNPCRRTSNDLDECVRDTFQNMFPFLAKGIPEIGMDPFEPLHIDYVGIKKGQGPVTLAGSFKNLIIHGPSNTTAVYTRFDLKRNKLDIGLFIPTIKVDATYDLKGKLLLLPLVGVGHAKLHLKNVSTNVATDIYFPKMAGEEVMVASSMKVNFSLTHMRVYLDNLFNGNKVLGRSVNQFLNQNALLVVEELKETIGENLAVVFKKVMNDAFSHIPTKLWLMSDNQAALRNDTQRSYGTTQKPKDKDAKNKTEDLKTQTKPVASTTQAPKTTEPTTSAKPATTTSTTTTAKATSEANEAKTTTAAPEEAVSEFSDNADEILEGIEESRVDGEESQSSRSENNNQLDQLQAESNNRLRSVRPATKQTKQ
ncbi:hypothetical protein M8J77_001082 [Diaphorina citri]|nr:hypothetical protein M8J77_001082 [Diaphorina citri]